MPTKRDRPNYCASLLPYAQAGQGGSHPNFSCTWSIWLASLAIYRGTLVWRTGPLPVQILCSRAPWTRPSTTWALCRRSAFRRTWFGRRSTWKTGGRTCRSTKRNPRRDRWCWRQEKQSQLIISSLFLWMMSGRRDRLYESHNILPRVFSCDIHVFDEEQANVGSTKTKPSYLTN